jgi:HK97 family phage portal protein
MKLWDAIVGAPDLTFQAQSAPIDISAADLAPFNTSDVRNAFFGSQVATRAQAMSVPAISRARSIICSTIASLPMEQRIKSTGERVETARVINQPDPRVPGSAVYAWLAEDLLFYGYGYLMQMDSYAEDGRCRSAERIAPHRVSIITNANGTEITGYRVDGTPVPAFGNGSLKVFYGLDEGLLNRAGRTILSAVELEKAALLYAKEPVPMMVLKSNGTALPADRVTKLLDAWRTARSTRATAFLNADVELTSLGFDPEKLQLNAARQYIALECARAVGIPAYFLGADVNTLTYSNAVSERKSLIDFSLRNIMTAIEERLSQSDFVASNTVIRYDFDDFLRGSALERAQIYEILNRIGVMSVDEIRRDEELIS